MTQLARPDLARSQTPTTTDIRALLGWLPKLGRFRPGRLLPPL